ncbi:MAG: catalase-related domain-containing protein, partial [Kofleriaceae bacterium]
YAGTGAVQRYDHRDDADYHSQAGALYRLMREDQRALLVANIVGAMRSVPAHIQDRQIAHFKKADDDYGARVERGLAHARAGDPRQVPVVK